MDLTERKPTRQLTKTIPIIKRSTTNPVNKRTTHPIKQKPAQNSKKKPAKKTRVIKTTPAKPIGKRQLQKDKLRWN